MTLDLTAVRFGRGSHLPRLATGDRDMCIMEAVAFFASETWGDSPLCACPIISAFLRSWNDTLSDDDRDRLLPADKWVPRLIGSRSNAAVEERRSYLILDWIVRVYTPAWFDLVPGLVPQAAALRALPEIDEPTAQNARNVLWSAREAAQNAPYDAVWDGAWYAEIEKARTTARKAVQDAAGAAAWDAIEDTQWGVTVSATRATAQVAARVAAELVARALVGNTDNSAQAALQSTVETLQQSALDLLDRVLACK